MTKITAACLAVAVASLVGCAAPRHPMEWTKIRAEANDLTQVMARCDYETTAATQGTDYSLRSGFGQELDRAMRKRDLEQKCMLANGWSLRPISSTLPPRTPEQLASAARYRLLGEDLSEANRERLVARATLTASPYGANAAALSAQIAALNARIFDIESQLGYSKSKPISAAPVPALLVESAPK